MVKRVAAFFSLITGVFTFAALFLFVGAFARTSLLPPFTKVGPFQIGLLTREEAVAKLQAGLDDYSKNPKLFVFQGEVSKISPQDLGISFDASQTIHRIPAVRTSNNIFLMWDTFLPRHTKPVFQFAPGKIENVLEQKFSQVKLLQNASLRFDAKAKKILIEPEQEGFTFDEDHLVAHLETTYQALSSRPLFLRGIHKKPLLSSQELEEHQKTLLHTLPKRIFLRHENAKWKLEFPEDIEYLEFFILGETTFPPRAHRSASLREASGFAPLPFVRSGMGPTRPIPSLTSRLLAEAPTISPMISEKKLERFLEKNEIPKTLENPPEGVKIFATPAGDTPKIIFEGRGKVGKTIDRPQLRLLLDKALLEKLDSIQIPILQEEPFLEISEDLQRLGIQTLIGTGYSTYVGSPPNRKHNIGVGVEHFNGLIIKPGEVFSFNENLGEVEAFTGYKPELVIRPDGTKPEYGGGLCQVSTTMYRAAAYSGLPILERSPHSYAVTYYSQAGGHGLDATIYPGVKDLKFLNDTPGYILIQAYIEGDAAYFKFYGTSDGRKVSFEGPFISNKRTPGADEIVYTQELSLGKKKQEQKPVTGFDALWYRYVTKDDATEKEEIFSRYRAVPAKFLVGGEGPSSTDPTLEAARQFE